MKLTPIFLTPLLDDTFQYLIIRHAKLSGINPPLLPLLTYAGTAGP